MSRRHALVTVFAVLLTWARPSWMSVDWSNPVAWAAQAPMEDVAAAIARLAALGLAWCHLGRVAIAHLALQPKIRLPRAAVAVGVALAGMASPAAAGEARLPVTPPDTIRPLAEAVWAIVERGDSMWTIAEDHAAGDVAPFWRRVVEVNRARFADVDLIHPGDRILLPAVGPEG